MPKLKVILIQYLIYFFTLNAKYKGGMVFVNSIVKTDYRLPCGGVKNSGFGRECSHYGFEEFANIKTVWIDK